MPVSLLIPTFLHEDLPPPARPRASSSCSTRGGDTTRRLFRPAGTQEEMNRVAKAYSAGDTAAAMAALSDALLDDVLLLGPPARIREGIDRFARVGVQWITMGPRRSRPIRSPSRPSGLSPPWRRDSHSRRTGESSARTAGSDAAFCRRPARVKGMTGVVEVDHQRSVIGRIGFPFRASRSISAATVRRASGGVPAGGRSAFRSSCRSSRPDSPTRCNAPARDGTGGTRPSGPRRTADRRPRARSGHVGAAVTRLGIPHVSVGRRDIEVAAEHHRLVRPSGSRASARAGRTRRAWRDRRGSRPHGR